MKNYKKVKKIIFVCGIFLFLFFALPASAASVGEVANFNVEKDFDATARNQVAAELVKTTGSLYFYVEKSWWDDQPILKRNEILTNLDNLSREFDSRIYPTLTSMFGYEWRPGVDGENRITVLFEAMNSNEGGYFREADEYIKLQLPISNEKEMLYLSLDKISDPQIKVVLAHEFMHLITFNQKNKIFGVEEDTWFNEARADYSSTILGYDGKYEGSNLQQRAKDFAENPSDSITEWKGAKYDYASCSIFMHYLIDHYGVNILIDSLKSKQNGIDSINYALKRNGFQENFSQIFTNWTVAVIFNNCSLDEKYCYLNQNLKNFRIAPNLNFLPVTGDVSLIVNNVTKSWTGNWLKFIGGNGELKLDFSSLAGLNFQVPYIIEDSVGSKEIKFLQLDKNEKGEIDIKKFGTDYKSLIIIPSLQPSISFADGFEPTYPFTYAISIAGSQSTDDQQLIQKLLEQIAYLKTEIAKLQGKGSLSGQTFCSELGSNLYPGMSNSEDVRCLQTFLKSQGVDIYPQGLVTGYFGSLTKTAVIKFQEKYKSDILTPIGLQNGTGIVGEKTRAKINQLLAGA